MLEFIAQYWLGVLFGAIIIGMQKFYGGILKRNQEEMIRDNCLEEAIQALLRDRIIQTYNYYLEKGYFPIHARENLDELMKQYIGLGGNGMVNDLVKRLRMLPTEKKDSQTKG